MTPSHARTVRLLLELGRGGMGVVYLALQQGQAGFTKLKVVKRLRPDLASESGSVQMFLEEGRLSARLHHPNVVQTNEVGFDGEHYFLEMEFLEGQSLEALVTRAERTGGLPIATAVFVLARALTGLHYAHELTDNDGAPLAVVHRDVSPHNVFVTYDGHVKLLDFGIAKAADSQHETQTGAVKGKVTYMAPEQVARKPLDRRVDVFAAGVILWQMLAGERLWKDTDGFEILLKLRSESFPLPSSVRPVDATLEAICSRAMAREPADRFASAAEMQTALDAWLDASGERITPKEIAQTMATLFADDRATSKRAIDAAIRSTPSSGSAIVPMLPRPAVAVTGTNAATASTVGGETRVRQAKEIRGMRALALASVGIALVASVSAAVITVRNRTAARTLAAPAPVARTTGGCSRNAECATGQICRPESHACIPLATERCAIFAETADVASDRTLWIGAMYPKTSSDAATLGVPSLRAVDLARRDFLESTRGIPGHKPDSAPRPLGVVACDDAQDATSSARHLAVDVGVPAVVGFDSSAEAIELAHDIFVPNGVLVVSTNDGAEVTDVVTPNGGPRLVWRTTPSASLAAVPAARFVSDLVAKHALDAGAQSDPSAARVAIVRSKTDRGAAIGATFVKALADDGGPSPALGGALDDLPLDDASEAGSRTDRTALVRRLIERAPVAIVLAGGGALLRDVVAAVESGWEAKDHRPVWIDVSGLETAALLPFLGKDADRRRRFFGVAPAVTTSPNTQLAVHYGSEFARVALGDTPAAPYDAAYLIAYAAFVADDGPITGEALAKSIARLVPPGKKLDVGPTHIFEVVDLLRAGANVDLVGAKTKLDFDLATGEPSVDWVVQCVTADARGVASQVIESGLTFDSASGKLVGALRCP